MIARLNRLTADDSDFLRRTSVVFLTFGTARVYEHKLTSRVVANCHKFPASMFDRRCLTADEASEAMFAITESLLKVNPEMKVIFTVSPIRHLADGFHGNTLSKATLHMAVSRVTARYPHSAFYFPAYEALMDDLRDYRFYAPDLCHPSEQAADYIFDLFARSAFTPEAIKAAERCRAYSRRMAHRPLTDDTEAIEVFSRATANLRLTLLNDYPYLSRLI